ncbi:hypothetical protein [Dankookia sp. P2]|uniref:hypothetical protein n=1 Tax=Dankookia sp. P2 TaxID=3423955 RepID=UPI003D66BEE6
MARSVSFRRPSLVDGSPFQRAAVSRQAFCAAIAACTAAAVTAKRSNSAFSAVVRSVVYWRVRAWKKVRRCVASTFQVIASVCALFAPVSATASNDARTAISS